MSGNFLRCIFGLVALSVAPVMATSRKPTFPPVAVEITKIGFYPLRLSWDRPSPTLWGTVNRNPALFLVDTGFSLTTIDRQVAREAESLPTDAARQMGPLLGPSEGTNWFVIRHLTLAHAEFVSLPARIMDLRLGGESAPRQDGILGTDFLRQNRALIFCGEDQMLLSRHLLQPAEQKKLEELLQRAGYTEVTMENLPSAAWAVPVRMGETKFKMLVDTGAASTLLNDELGKRPSVRKSWGLSVEIKGVENRETKARRATVRDFQIGTYSAPDSKVMLGNTKLWNPTISGKPSPGFGAGPTSTQGMLGIDLLKLHGAVIDCHAGKLWLRPPSK